jgi:cytoskeletal protein RodZ
VITSEELRLAALATAAKRGKWVARRRIFRRWLLWLVWTLVLPVIGLVTVVMSLVGLAFWQYMGHDAAYAATQIWVQQEFGSSKTSSPADNAAQANHAHGAAPSKASMINLTDEATPDLQIDRQLSIKNAPAN